MKKRATWHCNGCRRNRDLDDRVSVPRISGKAGPPAFVCGECDKKRCKRGGKFCDLCLGMAHRVDGATCRRCGLAHVEAS